MNEQIASVKSLMKGKAPANKVKVAKEPKTITKTRKKRQVSPEARQRMAEAQKKRWAKARGEA